MFFTPAFSYSVVEFDHRHDEEEKFKEYGGYTENSEKGGISDILVRTHRKPPVMSGKDVMTQCEPYSIFGIDSANNIVMVLTSARNRP